MSVGGREGRLGLSRIVLAQIVIVVVAFYAVPLLAMARFAFQFLPVRALDWSNLSERWSLEGLRRAFGDEAFRSSLWLSVQLAAATIVLTLGLLLPTAIWAHLRAPRWRPVVEAVTLLPWVVPPIALVVGVAATFRGRAGWFLSSPFSLVPFYVVLALPFTYRSLDAGLRAIDLRTLTEASRSLGDGWWGTIRRVVLPNVRSAALGSAFLTATVVLGEFTISALLLKTTFPTYLAEYQRSEPQGGMALALLSMLATTAVLMLVTLALRRRNGAAVAMAGAG